ncbi:hypothetical protein Tco_1355755 [Tanacetum coccineum]
MAEVDDVSLVDGVFDGAFGGDGDEDFVMGEGFKRGGLCGSHGSKREMKKMIVKMMNIVKLSYRVDSQLHIKSGETQSKSRDA